MDRFDKYVTPPQTALRQMIDGYRVSQLIGVAAELGIADLLKDAQALRGFSDGEKHQPRACGGSACTFHIGVFTQRARTASRLPHAEVLEQASRSQRPGRGTVVVYQVGRTSIQRAHRRTLRHSMAKVWQHRDQVATRVRFHDARARSPLTSRAVLAVMIFSGFVRSWTWAAERHDGSDRIRAIRRCARSFSISRGVRMRDLVQRQVLPIAARLWKEFFIRSTRRGHLHFSRGFTTGMTRGLQIATPIEKP